MTKGEFKMENKITLTREMKLVLENAINIALNTEDFIQKHMPFDYDSVDLHFSIMDWAVEFEEEWRENESDFYYEAIEDFAVKKLKEYFKDIPVEN